MAADIAGAREGAERQTSDSEDLEGGGHPGRMSRERGGAVQGRGRFLLGGDPLTRTLSPKGPKGGGGPRGELVAAGAAVVGAGNDGRQ